MSTPVHRISDQASLATAEESIRNLGITSLLAVDDDGLSSGVITATDLIRAGLRNAGHRQRSALLAKTGKVADIMTRDVVAVEPGCSLAQAAAKMLERRVHRLFVATDGEITGVLSTRDIMSAVEEVRVNKPVSQFMSTPVFTVRSSEPISLATERLGKARVTGLIVVDESGWPVGIFGQEEALDAGETPRSETVEHAMDAAVLTLPDHCAIHNVARQALAMGARRIAVMNSYELVGIMTGVDFAKAIQ